MIIKKKNCIFVKKIIKNIVFFEITRYLYIEIEIKMCQCPIKIKNPSKYRNAYASELGKRVDIPKYLLPSDDYIEVPCGKCSECRATYHNSILQRAIVESMSSYIYFITLTYDNAHIPSIEIDGEKFLYADYDHIQNMFKRFRNLDNIDGREFRYLTVNEYGDKKHRPHFHILLFVAKLDGDNETTPHFIQDVLFKSLGPLFSINVGTRKNPKYERLFTYKFKYTSQGPKTNYFVKYVEPSEFYKYVSSQVIDESYVKTVRYLIGYINKPSKYEQKIECILNNYKKQDDFLYNKLRHLLKSQIRYSKGFGCGFTQDGKKYYMDKISVRASSNVLIYTDLVDNLPDDYNDFKENYEDLYNDLREFIKEDHYSRYNNWKKCLNSFSSHEYLLHCIYLKYFRKEFSIKYNSYKDHVKPTVSYNYDFVHRGYLYDMPKVRTTTPEDSPIYRYLRQGIEEGINAKVPFLAFKMVGEKSYTALCKYYKDRVCTIDDQVRLFQILGVNSYEEWLDLFSKSKNNNKIDISKGNEYKYYNDDDVDISTINETISGEQVYKYLFQ